MPHPDDHQRSLRVRVATAAITGIISGAVRAITGWLLAHLTSTW